MKLKDLHPHPRNPRKITDKKLKMLEKSLKEFGDLGGIVFNRKTGRLISGHQRAKILPKDSEIIMDTQDSGHINLNGDIFKIRFVDWDETKEKAGLLAANKHKGEWDIAPLSETLIELDQANIDMEVTGFDEDALKSLFGGKKEEKEKQPKTCPHCGGSL